jgi:hypothetical protein
MRQYAPVDIKDVGGNDGRQSWVIKDNVVQRLCLWQQNYAVYLPSGNDSVERLGNIFFGWAMVASCMSIKSNRTALCSFRGQRLGVDFACICEKPAANRVSLLNTTRCKGNAQC